jgi:DNA-binding HxlR family transcriptional regulator
MTELAADEDLGLFRSFAGQETRRVLEALLDGDLRQKELATALGVSPQVVGQAVGRLEAAGLVARTSARGKIYLVHYNAIAKLLEMEADLTATIQADRSERSSDRLRELRKRAMRGRSKLAEGISTEG